MFFKMCWIFWTSQWLKTQKVSAPWSPVLVLCSNLKKDGKKEGKKTLYYLEYSKDIGFRKKI